MILEFLQLFTNQILVFAPCYTLSSFFTPLITRFWLEQFLHFPLNFVLLPSLIYYAQAVIYLCLGALLLAVTVRVIAAAVNSKKRIFSPGH